MADNTLIDGIDILSHCEKILTANEQETCRAKSWGVGGLVTMATVASESCTQPNLTESLVLETSES